MLSTGQPMHAFDKTHIEGNKIIVRNAKKDEKLLLLDNNEIELTTDDLVITDIKSVLALAGIRGGKKDSTDDDASITFRLGNSERVWKQEKGSWKKQMLRLDMKRGLILRELILV